jgi:hypothetical protein
VGQSLERVSVHFAGKSALRAHAAVQADKLKMIAAVEETARARGYDIEVVKLSVQPWRCERCGQDKDRLCSS